MGRWLDRVEKGLEDVPTKLTKPSSVSFVSTTSERFQDNNYIESIKKSPSRGAIKKDIHDANIGFVSFVSTPSSHFLHRERKQALRQGRLVILRNLIKQCFGDDWVYVTTHWDELEDIIDRALKDYDYDLEQVIDNYRKIAPPFTVHDPRCKCGYMPPFHHAHCTNRIKTRRL